MKNYTEQVEQIIQDAFKRAPDPTYKHAYALGVLKGHAAAWLECAEDYKAAVVQATKALDDANREIARSRDMEAV